MSYICKLRIVTMASTTIFVRLKYDTIATTRPDTVYLEMFVAYQFHEYYSYCVLQRRFNLEDFPISKTRTVAY